MGSTTWIFIAAVAAYALAAPFFFRQLFRGGEQPARFAQGLMGVATIAHGVFVVTILRATGLAALRSLHAILAVASLLLGILYLATMRRNRLNVLGAFITPVILFMLVASGIGARAAHVTNEVRSVLLPFHIIVNTLGIVAFALAFAVAIAYMIQEQRLRQRELGGVFQRLPALDVLDTLGLRLTTIGFSLSTIGMLTGSFWAVRTGHGHVKFSPGQGFAILSWLFFATVLLFRAAAGWRGRRAALGTVLGFLCAIAALLGYVSRGLGAS